MSLQVLHATLATVTAAAAFALVAAAGFALVRRSAYSIRLVRLVRRIAVVAAVLVVAVGAMLLITGSRPRAGLHVMYAFFAVVAVPVAAQLAASNPRRGALYHLLAGLLLLGLCFRLAGTG